MVRRLPLLLCLLMAVLLLTGDIRARRREMASTPLGTPFLVHAQGGRLLGPAGQELFLRGVNVNALVAYNPAYPEAVPVTPFGFQEMAALGLNFVRLPLSLSRLEPRPGEISAAYLREIQQVVAWARRQGIYVLLDLHQDHYSAGLFPGESDGMPSWMVDTLGFPSRPILLGVTNPAVQGAFTAFWQDRRLVGLPLWQAYDRGLRALAATFRGNPDVLGYDVMNEPNPGWFLGQDFPRRYLLPFYEQALAALRDEDRQHLVFLEPDVVSMATGRLVWPADAFLHQGVVFEPHEYLPVGLFPSGHGGLLREATAFGAFDALYRLAAEAAAKMQLPWLVGEFGAPPTRLGDAMVAHEVELQDRYGVGSAFWLWQIEPRAYDWELVLPNGALTEDTARLRAVTSPHPTVVGGRILGLSWQASRGTFTFRYQGLASAGPTVVVTSSVAYPKGIVWRCTVEGVQETTYRLAIPGGVLTTYRLEIPATDQLVTVEIRPR